jgi:hypothetical protein
VCPIPDACLLVMAQRPYRLLGLPETRSLIFLINNSPDQVEGYLDYLQLQIRSFKSGHERSTELAQKSTNKHSKAQTGMEKHKLAQIQRILPNCYQTFKEF